MCIPALWGEAEVSICLSALALGSSSMASQPNAPAGELPLHWDTPTSPGALPPSPTCHAPSPITCACRES